MEWWNSYMSLLSSFDYLSMSLFLFIYHLSLMYLSIIYLHLSNLSFPISFFPDAFLLISYVTA